MPEAELKYSRTWKCQVCHTLQSYACAEGEAPPEHHDQPMRPLGEDLADAA